MKRLVLALILPLLLGGCYTHINQVKDKWGPPAKVEHRKDTMVYYYYFYKGKAVVFGGDTVAGGEVTAGWIVVEITTDPKGKILKKRKYSKQPKLE